MISVYGATGFIGTRFCNLYADEVIKIPRNERAPQSSEVLYLISTTHNYNIFSDPHVDVATNLTTLIETLESCKGRDDMVFNFVSSWFVYGKTESLPATEESYCNPKGFYSITKRAAEQLLISYCETFDVNYRILRLSNVYGESDLKVSGKRNALQHLIGELAHDRDINLYDDGANIRDFMYVQDVCRALKLCMTKMPVNDIINIGSGKPRRFRDLMEYSKRQLKSKGALIPIVPPKFHDIVQIKDMFLDVTKLKQMGFEEEHTIWEGLDKILETYK